MEEIVLKIVAIIRDNLTDEELIERLDDYHYNDIAAAFEELTKKERLRLYKVLGTERISNIFSYIEDTEVYVKEMDIQKLAGIVSEMDSDDAVDLLDDLDEETIEKLRGLLDKDAREDIELIQSYDEDEIGSRITTNYILIKNNLTVRQAMAELVAQAGENDNISTIYVVDKDDCFYGAIDLKDLIIARDYVELDSLISTGYPYLEDHDLVSDCIQSIKDYAEDSLPVLNSDKKVIGIITSQDILEVIDDEMGEDYAKLAGLTAEEDMNERIFASMRKRLPWLLILLVLGMGISTVVGIFESVVAVIPIVICFQSLILDMAGNVGTQSLAVTIRVLMDEQVGRKHKLKLVLKEMRVGFANGLLLGLMAFVFVGLYIMLFKHNPAATAFSISACVGLALLLAMVISSLTGTVIPIFFHKIKVDPAVASGPLITTVNDLVAVVTYYGLSWILLVNMLHLG